MQNITTSPENTMGLKSNTVLHVLSSLNIGGAERFVIDLATEQQQSLKLNCAILSFGGRNEPLVDECAKNNIPVFFIEGSRLQKILAFRKTIKKFSVLHFHSPFTLLFACYNPVLCYQKKVIYTRHGAEPFNQLKWRMMHKMAKHIVNQITFVSDEGKAVFDQTHGWEHKPQSVVDNGILIPQNNNQSSTAQHNLKIRLGSVARMVPLKNQICLLKALSIMPPSLSKQFEIHFFGNGPCEKLLKEESEKFNFTEQVVFHGMLINREEIYKNMDVMVVTSEMEGLSIAILEAMARKIPVLATNVGGNPKLVQNNITGQLFEYNDDKKLAELLTDIATSPKLINEWGVKAFQLVQQSYSLETVAQKYMKLYLAD